MIAASLGKMPTTSARRLTSLLSRSSGLVLCNLRRCGSGKSRYDSTSVSLSSINAASFGDFDRNWSATRRSIWLAWARSGCKKAWRSAAATMLCCVLGTWARALRIQCTRQRCQLAPNTRRIAALSPSCASEITSFTPRSPRRAKLLRKVDQGLSLRRADVQPDNFAPAIAVGRHSDYRGNRDVAAALALLQIGGIEPQIRPLSGQRAIEKGMHAFVDLLAQLGDLRLADPRQPHRLNQIVDTAGRHAADPGFLDDRDQRLLRALAGFEKRREIATLAQLRDAQLQRAEPGIEGALAVAIAPRAPLTAALVAPGTDQPLDVGLHQQLQHRLRHGS